MPIVGFREPLIKSECRTNSMSLRDLKRAAARRDSQLMAKVLSKGCNNAEVRFRPRPKGPSEQPYLCVGAPSNVQTLLRDTALIYDCSEGQRYRILDQRLPARLPDCHAV